jgi:hypothetical protein
VLRYFLSRRLPEFSRVLLVESGSRALLEKVIPLLRGPDGSDSIIDVVTCYGGVPQGLNTETARIYRVADYAAGASRRALAAEIRDKRYDAVGIICSAEPIMTKWKWWIAARAPAKVFVINENGDYFWLDRGHWRTMLQFALYRAGVTGASAAPAMARLLCFPVTFAYLVAFAAWVHLKRAVRMSLAARAQPNRRRI